MATHIEQSAVRPSTRKDKKFMRTVKEVDSKGETIREKKVHFGDPKLSIKKSDKKRQENYCARSAGIKGTDDPFSANYQSREKWNCKQPSKAKH